MIFEEIGAYIAKEIHVKTQQVQAVIKLLDDGNTVPFIARYRKEATGELEDEQIRVIEDRLTYLRNLIKRQAVYASDPISYNELTISWYLPEACTKIILE